MKRTLAMLSVLLLSSSGLAEPRPLVFIHVTVIDATGAPAQPDQTVIVTGDRLSAVGRAGKVRVPQGAQVVDGTGKFMIPGLWDMHAHTLIQDPQWGDGVKDYFPLYIANGVTGVREMFSLMSGKKIAQLRTEMAAGKILGPRIMSASRIIDGPVPFWPGSLTARNEAEGRKVVQSLKEEDYDFVKVYSLLPREAYFAIVAEAKKRGLPVAGHVPYSVSAAEASDAGQKSIEHLNGVLEGSSTKLAYIMKVYEGLVQDPAALKDRAGRRRCQELILDTYDENRAAALFKRFVANGTWHTPTLTILRSYANVGNADFFEDPRLKYIPARVRETFDPKNDFRVKDFKKEDVVIQKRLFKKQMEIVGAMRRAGVELLAGTDAIDMRCYPGFSLHDELELLVQAGLTPMEAIQAATRNPAKYLQQLEDFGTVEQGKIADLILLDGNPLDDIRNTTKIQAVVMNGKLLPRATLHAMLDKVEAECKEKQNGGKAVHVPSFSQADQKHPPAQWTPELMMKVKDITSVVPSPDGKRVAYAVREAVMEGEKSEYLTQIHVANSDGSGGYQLTQGEKSSEDPQWSPDGETLAFVSDRSGKKNVWLIRVGGGEASQLTDVRTGVSNFKWSPDGKSVAYTAVDPPTPEEEKAAKVKNDARVLDAHFKMNRIYVIPVAKDVKGKRTACKLSTGNYSVGSLFDASSFDWSPDSKTIAFSHAPTPSVDDWTKADISVVDVASGSLTPLLASGAMEISPHYSRDGRWIAFVKSDNPPTWAINFTVQVVSATGGEPRELAETFDRQPTLVGWTADSKKIYYTEAHGTTNRLCALPLQGSPEVICHQQGVMGLAIDEANVQLNASGVMVGFGYQTTHEPIEAFVSRLDRIGPVRVSSVNERLLQLSPGRTEIRRWKSGAGLQIEGLLTLPVNYEPGKRYPLLLIIHGGPPDAFGQEFIAAQPIYLPYPMAVFAAKGYAILRCNPRGSIGYGKVFRYSNYKDWGGGDYQDLMAGVDEMIRLGIADPERLGVAGWSYGGYMTSWIITQTKRFKAASVGAGLTNLLSMAGTSDILGLLPAYFGAEPWDDLEVYRKHSAMFNVKGVKTPTLIQHGEKDARVPIGQGYELYNALKRQGCTVEMVVYPRMGHITSEPKQKLDLMRRNVEWFDKYVGGKKATGKK
ncbi:MAG TPA: prolyl oligopeptidase family serine peptidase [Gemmataceae bacterium]|nr:prolyl oligopeptidase family serine peptidase [Gemmataceae bacterium]